MPTGGGGGASCLGALAVAIGTEEDDDGVGWASPGENRLMMSSMPLLALAGTGAAMLDWASIDPLPKMSASKS